MQSDQTIGIDLPLKALVWEDANGRVNLAYNDPRWLGKRHGLNAGSNRVVDAMSATLAEIAQKASARP